MKSKGSKSAICRKLHIIIKKNVLDIFIRKDYNILSVAENAEEMSHLFLY